MPDFLFTEIANQNINANTAVIQTSGRDTVGLGASRYVADGQANAALQAAHPRFVARSSNNRYFRALPEAGRIAVEVGGAKADGTTDDGPAIRATFAYAAATGARGASFGGATYRAEAIPPGELDVPGNQPMQVLPSTGAIHDYGGASLTRQNGGRGLVYHPGNLGQITELPLGADAVAGSREVTLANSASGLVAGDTVLWQLGELPYDTPETDCWDFARVEAVNGTVVRLDKPVPRGLALASVTGQCKRLRKFPVLRDYTVRDLTLGGAGGEDGIALYGGQRVHLARIGGRNLGAGVVVAQYCDGLTIEDCWQDGSILTQGSFGPAFNLAETRNVLLLRPRAKGTLCLIKAEAAAEATVIGGCFENTAVDTSGQSRGSQIAVVVSVGRSSVTLHDLTVTGFGGYRLVETSNGQAGYEGAALLTGTTRLVHSADPYSLPLDAISGTLDLTLAGVREVYNFDRLRHWRRRFALRDGQYLYAFGPAGLLVRARAYASPGLAIGVGQQLTGFYLGRSGNNGSNIADGATRQLEAGKDVAIPCFGGLVGGAQWILRNEPFAILCITPTTAGLDTANEFVEFEGWFAEQPDLDVPLSEAAVRGAGSEREVLEALFPGYDLPAIAAGASLAIELAVPDMMATDFVEAVRITGGLTGLELRGAEAIAGQVRLTITNPTPATIDRTTADLAIAFSHPNGGA
jgi:hypothetical protein